MSVIKLGPFMINGQLLALILAMFIAYVVSKFRLQQLGQEDRTGDIIGNAIVIVFIVWKLSLVVVDPIMVFRHPLTLLYFDGGAVGWGLASILAVIYFMIQVRKQRTTQPLLFEGLLIGWLAGSFAFRLFHLFIASDEHTLSVSALLHLVFLFVFLLWLLWQKRTIQPLDVWLDRIIVYGLAFIGIELMNGDRHIVIVSFTIAQIVHIVIVLIAFMIKLIVAKTSHKLDGHRR